MNQRFIQDFDRMTGEYFTGSPKDFFKIIMRHNLRFMYLFRKYQQRKSILTRIALYRLTRKYGLEVSVDANIGDGLYLGHPYNITVAEGSVIGSNVYLHKGCTIGRETRGKRAGTPTIGSRVCVGINATIVGNITIGDDVLIAPNSFVNCNVPDHSVVIGNPAQIYARTDATENYVNFCV